MRELAVEGRTMVDMLWTSVEPDGLVATSARSGTVTAAVVARAAKQSCLNQVSCAVSERGLAKKGELAWGRRRFD